MFAFKTFSAVIGSFAIFIIFGLICVFLGGKYGRKKAQEYLARYRAQDALEIPKIPFLFEIVVFISQYAALLCLVACVGTVAIFLLTDGNDVHHEERVHNTKWLLVVLGSLLYLFLDLKVFSRKVTLSFMEECKKNGLEFKTVQLGLRYKPEPKK